MKNTQITLLSLFALVLSTGCARDRDSDDYKRGKLEEDLAKLEAITGVYAGQLLANKSGESLGMIGLQLEADTRINNFNEEIPVLKGALLFQSSSIVKIVFANSTFNSDTNVFKMTSSVKVTADGETFDLDFTGVPVGNTINAKFETFGYSELGAKSRLERVVSAQAFEDAFSTPTNPEAPSYGTIKKFYRGKNQLGKDVALSYSNVGMTPEDRFLNAFLPNRKVVAILSLSPHLDLTFPNTTVAAKDGVISANEKRVNSGDTFNTTLNCHKTGMSGTKEKIYCRYHSSLNDRLVEMNLVESDEPN